MQWAKSKIAFTTLEEKITQLGDYKYSDWSNLFTLLFNHEEEEDVLGAISAVEAIGRRRRRKRRKKRKKKSGMTSAYGRLWVLG